MLAFPWSATKATVGSIYNFCKSFKHRKLLFTGVLKNICSGRKTCCTLLVIRYVLLFTRSFLLVISYFYSLLVTFIRYFYLLIINFHPLLVAFYSFLVTIFSVIITFTYYCFTCYSLWVISWKFDFIDFLKWIIETLLLFCIGLKVMQSDSLF